jgi:hypothetical protein
VLKTKNESQSRQYAAGSADVMLIPRATEGTSQEAYREGRQSASRGKMVGNSAVNDDEGSLPSLQPRKAPRVAASTWHDRD